MLAVPPGRAEKSLNNAGTEAFNTQTDNSLLPYHHFGTVTSQAALYFAVSISLCDHFWDINLSTVNSSEPTVSTCYKLFDQIQGQSTEQEQVSLESHSASAALVCPRAPTPTSSSPWPFRLPGSGNSNPTAQKSHTLNIPNLLQHKLLFYNTSCSLSPAPRLLWRVCSSLLPLSAQPWLCTAPHCTCVVAKYCNTLPREAWDMCLINTSMVQVAGEATKPESLQLHF